MNVKDNKYHFIAIGGVGMSALAKYLAERGAQVSGSDISESKYTNLLKDLGVKITIGHNPDLIQKDMIVVSSSAIKDNNLEITRAKELGLKIYHRSDVLKIISDEFHNYSDSYFIGFCGTHGKTTTSGLCAFILEKAGLYPSYVVGGIIPEMNTNGKYSDKKYFCAELDESDGTITKYSTDIAVINNIEEDHLDFYKNGFSDIANTFGKYLANNPNQKVLINIDDNGCLQFMDLFPSYNFITFGIKKGYYQARNIIQKGLSSTFDVYKEDKFITNLSLTIPGIHNIYNALAVFSSLMEANINPEAIKEHFSSFSGMGRRFQKVSSFNGIDIYDDYAHHPSEIKTTLKSIKDAVKDTKRVIAIFQPHRYTRLNSLWEEFKKAFDCADMLIITDIYSAGELPIQNVTEERFNKEIQHKNSNYIDGNLTTVAEKLYPLLQKDDIVITLGAGSITEMGKIITNIAKRK